MDFACYLLIEGCPANLSKTQDSKNQRKILNNLKKFTDVQTK